jgi:hypothetical protein
MAGARRPAPAPSIGGSGAASTTSWTPPAATVTAGHHPDVKEPEAVAEAVPPVLINI